MYEVLRIERDQLKNINEVLTNKVAELTKQNRYGSPAQTALAITLIGYSFSNIVLLFVNNQLLDPTLWSFWMRDFSNEELFGLKDEIVRRLIQDIAARYDSGSFDTVDTISLHKMHEVVHAFEKDCVSERKMLESYRTFTLCLKKVPYAEWLFFVDPGIYEQIEVRLERLSFCQSLISEALSVQCAKISTDTKQL